MGKNPHAQRLGRMGGLKGGRASSPAKTAAARANGRKGGRPLRSVRLQPDAPSFELRALAQAAGGQAPGEHEEPGDEPDD